MQSLERLQSAHAAVSKLLEDIHCGRLTAEEQEIQLGYIRNQLIIVAATSGEEWGGATDEIHDLRLFTECTLRQSESQEVQSSSPMIAQYCLLP